MTKRRAIFTAMLCLAIGAVLNVLEIAYSSLMGDGIDSGKISRHNAMMHCAGEIRLNAVPESWWPIRDASESYEWIAYIVVATNPDGSTRETQYLVGQFTRGWPCPAAVGWMTHMPDGMVRLDSLFDWGTATSPQFAGGAVLPLKMNPSGFLINTLFYAGLLYAIIFAPGAVRRRLRLRKNRCPFCAYPFGASPVCTECGRNVTKWNPSCATKQMMREP